MTNTQGPAGLATLPPGDAAVPEPARPVVSVRGLGKWFHEAGGDTVKAVDDVSFDLHPGRFLVLLGPSGCGKTTLLRCIAGLEEPHDGSIEVNGVEVFSARRGISVPAYRRNLSMVFQSYALWPHMTVFDNIAYPLTSRTGRARMDKAEIQESVHRLMATVGIPSLGARYPSQISGGQQQRVALCRALVAGSKAVLFDEPLSNVDAKVRERLREQLLALQRELGFAAIFVTHDRQEAMVLGDEVVVLDSGKVAQAGPPREIYWQPRSSFVAEFMGPVNRVDGSLAADPSDGTAVLDTEVGPIRGTWPAGSSTAADAAGPGRAMTALWRPESVTLAPSTPSGEVVPEGGENHWTGTMEQSLFSGAYVEHLVDVAGRAMRVLTTDLTPLEPGAAVRLSVSPDKVTLVDAT